VYDGTVNVSMGEQSLDLQSGQAILASLGQPLSPIEVSEPLPAGPTSPGNGLPSQGPPATPTRAATQSFPLIVTPTRPGDEARLRTVYIVQDGDTLSSIAEQFGLPWQLIWETNRAELASPELIRPGQKLAIPEP
jgi:nucleoid-associated protein YgaU